MKITEFIHSLVERTGKGKRYKYRLLNASRLIAEFDSNLTVQSFNQDTTEKYISFLKQKNYRHNTIYVLYHLLRHILNRASREYLIDSGYMNIQIAKEEPTTVHLTFAEIEQIIRCVNLSEPQLIVRDYFIVMCFTGLRLCDARNLNPNNISENKLVVKTSKTGQIVEIPISPPIREIFVRWGDNFPKVTSQQNFHDILRRICKKSGIDTEIVINYTRQGKLVQEKLKKYELISPHTGRRTFCTNLYLASEQQYIPLWRIMLMTGHKHEASFLGYVRITRSENVRKMQDHPFFNRSFIQIT